jgi:hypothetical protein
MSMTDEKNALVPVEERVVEFYEDELQGVIVMIAPSQRRIFVPVRPICDFLGVAWPAQRNRILRDPVLSSKMEPVLVTTAGGPQEMQCLPLDYLNGWLFGINTSRVKEEVRERLIRYQEECYQVLHDAFLGPEPIREAVSPNEAALLQIREMGLAIARMAEQQMEIERRTTATEERLERAAQYMGQFNRRLNVLERRLGPGEELTEEQAFEIKERVTQIALELARHDPIKSHFADVYRSLSLQTRRTSYKDIPQSAYENAIKFLDDWLRALQSDESG